MSKTKVLLVGEHPNGISGNSHMMKAVIDRIDKNLFDIACFSETPSFLFSDPFEIPEYSIIIPDGAGDQYGCKKLVETVRQSYFDIMVTIGVDLWHYYPIWNELLSLRARKGFKWGAIFPYDLIGLRDDWVAIINSLDCPKVYSIYGYELLKPVSPNIGYFRPPMLNFELFRKFNEEERKRAKNAHFNGHDDGRFVFGFIGNNQVRKDPQRAIKAYLDVKKTDKDIVLYMHCDFRSGVYNLGRFIEDCDASQKDVLIRNQNTIYSDLMISEVFNSIDCLFNTSLQEGLSWTVLQAQLCGIPVLGAYNTAQMELLNDNKGFPLPCTELSYLPIVTSSGPSHVETYACNFEETKRMLKMIPSMNTTEVTNKAYQFARDWVEHPSDINEYFGELKSKRSHITQSSAKRKKVLFLQHSSAGDVLMTTRCFKGLKERHIGYDLDYMTSSQYKNIIENNPHISEVLDWNEKIASEYEYIYNPHGDRIAPGHWGRNCNSILSDFYWKILDVEPDSFFIKEVEPNLDTSDWSEYSIKIDQDKMWVDGKPILIVHTTGGNSHFRTYKYMRDVCQALDDKYLTIQLGTGSDFPAWAKIDLRGKLTFQETAWVMSKARLAVTVDSFISHLAGALGVSQVCLFGSGNYVVVQPLQVSGKLICMSPDYVKHCKGLGPCSGCVTDCPVPCTSRHDPKDIIKNLDTLERWLQLKEIEDDKKYNPISLGGK